MSEISKRVTIDASPEEIWPYVGEPLQGLGLEPGDRSKREWSESHAVAGGSSDQGMLRLMGGRKPQRGALTVYDPPRRVEWTWAARGAAVTGRGALTLEPVGDGRTQVSIRVEYRAASLLGRLIEPLVGLMAPQLLSSMLATIQRELEA